VTTSVRAETIRSCRLIESILCLFEFRPIAALARLPANLRWGLTFPTVLVAPLQDCHRVVMVAGVLLAQHALPAGKLLRPVLPASGPSGKSDALACCGLAALLRRLSVEIQFRFDSDDSWRTPEIVIAPQARLYSFADFNGNGCFVFKGFG
jgi:hypothetical protein